MQQYACAMHKRRANGVEEPCDKGMSERNIVQELAVKAYLCSWRLVCEQAPGRTLSGKYLWPHASRLTLQPVQREWEEIVNPNQGVCGSVHG
jgi:hypothetical protein